MNYRVKPLFKRIIDKIDFDKKECWIWKGSKNKQQYGTFFDGKKTSLAHRLIYSLFINKDISETTQVCHKCDNPSCVNPYHLFLGTQLDNVKDMIQKNRNHRPKGEKNHKAKLTEKEVLSIRAEYIPHVTTNAELGRKYGVTGESIHAIITRKSWKHI